jgi:hypothetical protein
MVNSRVTYSAIIAIVFLGVVAITALTPPVDASTTNGSASDGNYICIGQCDTISPSPTLSSPGNSTESGSSTDTAPDTSGDSGSATDTAPDPSGDSGSATDTAPDTSGDAGSAEDTIPDSTGQTTDEAANGTVTPAVSDSANDGNLTGTPTVPGTQSPETDETLPEMNQTTADPASTTSSTPSPTQTASDSQFIAVGGWEQDTSQSLEDGDPLHAEPGSQFLPLCRSLTNKTIQYFLIVQSDEEEAPQNFTTSVKSPDGRLLYQVNMTRYSGANAVSAIETAEKAGLVIHAAGYTSGKILSDPGYLLYSGKAELKYDQMPGNYAVYGTAFGFRHAFQYLPRACVECDNLEILYGDTSPGRFTWVSGDGMFGTDGITVRNIGNAPARIQILQDDMEFGKDQEDQWTVLYQVQIGNGSIVSYYPGEFTEIADIIPGGSTLPLNFGILVLNGIGSHSGEITLGFTQVNTTIEGAWEQDISQSLEDGDPLHAEPGSQFLPVCQDQTNKTIQYFLIVQNHRGTSPEDFVTNVVNPDGKLLYQVQMTVLSGINAKEAALSAARAGLIAYAEEHSSEQVMNDVASGKAWLLTGRADLPYEQMGGAYRVISIDTGVGNQGLLFEHYFHYLAGTCPEVIGTSQEAVSV